MFQNRSHDVLLAVLSELPRVKNSLWVLPKISDSKKPFTKNAIEGTWQRIRNMAGLHYRSDHQESLLLGEKIALEMLAEQKACHNQQFTYSLTSFSGKSVTL